MVHQLVSSTAESSEHGSHDSSEQGDEQQHQEEYVTHTESHGSASAHATKDGVAMAEAHDGGRALAVSGKRDALERALEDGHGGSSGHGARRDQRQEIDEK